MSKLTEGVHDRGVKTFFTDGPILERFLFVEIGSDGEHVAPTNALSDRPLGICPDEADGAEDEVEVQVLGAVSGTLMAVAGETLAAGDLIVPGSDGRARLLPVTQGSFQVCGAVLSGGVLGELIEFAPSFPVLRVVA